MVLNPRAAGAPASPLDGKQLTSGYASLHGDPRGVFYLNRAGRRVNHSTRHGDRAGPYTLAA
ncbi:MAG: hypothetical protein C4289_01770 [Chloroflexota bacterium]